MALRDRFYGDDRNLGDLLQISRREDCTKRKPFRK
jgi:hypothetical protein